MACEARILETQGTRYKAQGTRKEQGTGDKVEGIIV